MPVEKAAASAPPKSVKSSGPVSVLPYIYNDKKFSEQISAVEKTAMKGEVELNVIEEPMDHFTTFDDDYLKKLLNEEKKGQGY